MNILVTGLPGSGKTTQAEKIAQKYGLCFIKAGEILREFAKGESPEALKTREDLSAGRLADDGLVAGLVKNALLEKDCPKGYVMDGFPRDVSQIKYFEPEFDKVFFLKVSQDVSRQRLSKRGRRDDTPWGIENRLSIQQGNLGAVLEYYRRKVQVFEIDGEKSIDEVFDNICRELE